MKNRPLKFLKILILTMCLFTFFVLTVEGSFYVGEYCLTLTAGDQSGESRLALSSIGPVNFLLNGTSTNSATSGTASVIGNAVLVGDKIIITLHQSLTDQDGMSISTGHYNLNASTLAGTFQQISQDYSGNFMPISHVSGMARVAPCN